MRKPAVGRGVELPEFADLSALPAAHGGQDFFGRDGMGELVFQRPAADLGAVELEGVQAEGFGSGEAVGTGRRAGQPLFAGGPRRAGARRWHGRHPEAAGRPERCLFAGAGGVVSGGQSVEATAGEAELLGGLGGGQRVLPEAFEHMADEGGRVTMDELLMLFKDSQNIRQTLDPVAPHHLFSLFDDLHQAFDQAGLLRATCAPSNDTRLIALDATWYFSSQSKNIHCPNCSCLQHADGTTTHFHSAITPVIVSPGHSQVVPLRPEFITPQDGQVKQDCEINAAKRWLAAHAARYSTGNDSDSQHSTIQQIPATSLLVSGSCLGLARKITPKVNCKK